MTALSAPRRRARLRHGQRSRGGRFRPGQGPRPARLVRLRPGWGSLPELVHEDRYSYLFLDLPRLRRRRGETGEFTLAEIAADALAAVDSLGWSTLRGARALDGRQRDAAGAAATPADRVSGLIGVSPVPSTGVPFDEQGWAAVLAAPRPTADNRYAIIDLTTGNRLSRTWVDRMVQFSLDKSDEAAFGAYLDAWARDGLLRRGAGPPRPGAGGRGRARPGPGRRGDGADVPGAVPERLAGGAAQRRALRDVRDAGRARYDHRGASWTSCDRHRGPRGRHPGRGRPGHLRDRAAARGAAPAAREAARSSGSTSPRCTAARRARASGWCCGTPRSSACCATRPRSPPGWAPPRSATRPTWSWVRRMMLNMDPPDHSRLRRLLSRSFTPRAVAALDGRDRGDGGRAWCDRMIDGAAEGRVRLRQGRRRRPAAAHPRRRPGRARRRTAG